MIDNKICSKSQECLKMVAEEHSKEQVSYAAKQKGVIVEMLRELVV